MPWTTQRIFDFVADHLRRQNQRSISVDGYCRYRGNNGLTCAVGCLIPPDKYDPNIEGMRAGKPQVLACLPADLLAPKGTHLRDRQLWILSKLQRVHDDEVPERWEKELGRLARREKLEVPCRALFVEES